MKMFREGKTLGKMKDEVAIADDIIFDVVLKSKMKGAAKWVKNQKLYSLKRQALLQKRNVI